MTALCSWCIWLWQKNTTMSDVDILIYGDSIVWGQVGPDERATSPWPAVFEEKTGYRVDVSANPGSTYSIGNGYGWNESVEETAFCNLVDSIDFSKYDYLMLGYGVNDYGYAIPIGNSTDTEKTTFMGALNYCFKKLSVEYANLKIIIITPMYAPSEKEKNPQGYSMSDYVDALIYMAQEYHFSVIDLNHGFGINEYNYERLYWDNLHPNQETYISMGEYIAQMFPGQAVSGGQSTPDWNKISITSPAEAVGLTAPEWHKDIDGFIHFVGRVSLQDSGLIGVLPTEATYPNDVSVITTAVTTDGTITFLMIDSQGVMSCGVTNKIIDLSSVPPYFVG